MMEGKKVLFEKYEVGRLLGKGNFGTVYHAIHIESGENVAIKLMRKDQVQKEGMMNQITREISVMRLVKHPNIVEIKEVMATKTKIYIVMEYIKGGDLFSKLEKEKKLKEDLARRYFQQLISAVDFCHSRGVYHRDLKLENLLLDESGTNLKVADFGLSAFLGQIHEDGLLHTMCGAPAYVAPEILKGKGYDGGKTDIWSCGVILYTMLAGHLPFQDENVMRMFGKISLGKYHFGPSFPHEPKLLIKKILVLKPEKRLGIQEMMKIPWFKKGFLGFTLEQKLVETPETNTESSSPAFFNAFEFISSMASGFDLSNLFEPKLRTRSTFTSRTPTSGIMSRIEEMGRGLKYKVTRMSEFQVKLVGPTEGRKGPLSVVAEVSEVASEVAVVEFSKSAGDTLEYLHFCEEEARPALKDIVWSWQGENVIPLVTDTTSVPNKI